MTNMSCRILMIGSALVCFSVLSCSLTAGPTLTPASQILATPLAEQTEVSTSRITETPVQSTTTAVSPATAIPTLDPISPGQYLVYTDRIAGGLYAVSLDNGSTVVLTNEYTLSARLWTPDKQVALFDGQSIKFLSLRDLTISTVKQWTHLVVPFDNLRDSMIGTVMPVTDFAVPIDGAKSPQSADVVLVAGMAYHNLPINGDGSFLYYFSGGEKLSDTQQGSNPAWSPDGKQLAFESESYFSPPDGMTQPYQDIAVWTTPCESIRAGCFENLTHVPEGSDAREPAWAPDSRQLAYVCSGRLQDGSPVGEEICVINLDGSNPRVLTDTPEARERSPVWSLDGRRIAFIRYNSVTGEGGIYIADLANESEIRLPEPPGESPKLLFWWDYS